MSLAIVDDDEDVRKALARLLRCLGHVVRVFASAEEFEAETVSADCLIVDVCLPGISGLELCDRLRSRGTPTPVVFITGDTDPGVRDALDTSLTPSVSKPFDDATLMDAIGAAIASNQAGECRAL